MVPGNLFSKKEEKFPSRQCGNFSVTDSCRMKHTYGIFAAEHESNLTTWVSWDGAVGVLHHRE